MWSLKHHYTVRHFIHVFILKVKEHVELSRWLRICNRTVHKIQEQGGTPVIKGYNRRGWSVSHNQSYKSDLSIIYVLFKNLWNDIFLFCAREETGHERRFWVTPHFDLSNCTYLFDLVEGWNKYVGVCDWKCFNQKCMWVETQIRDRKLSDL